VNAVAVAGAMWLAWRAQRARERWGVEALEQGRKGHRDRGWLWLANKGSCGGGAGLVLLAEADRLVAILVRDGLRGNLLCIHPSLVPNSFAVLT